ncbi:uncharacterized protein LOC141622592 isoform X2 [Silene latifolia]|uniref:uncharacterized protein LOC141622592 isoform X2 n=1 Tax=Silene latifolia TaxID=37657 RepID=UPI003D77E677
MDDHGRRKNPGQSTSRANGDKNPIEVDKIIVIPDTPVRLCKKQNICRDAIFSPHSNSQASRVTNSDTFDGRVQFLGNNTHTSKVDPHYRGDFGDINGSCCVNSPAALSSFRNALSLSTVAERNIEVKKILSHDSFPEMSYRRYNRDVVPMFDHGGIKKASKDVASLHIPSTSFKSTRNEDKGKGKTGNDIPVYCDAYPVKRNDEVSCVVLEHNTEEGIPMPYSSVRGPNTIKRKSVVHHGHLSPHTIQKATISVESSRVSSYAKCNSVSGQDKCNVDIGNDNLVHCDAYPMTRNDEVSHVALEHNTGKGVSAFLSSIQAPHTIKSKRLVHNGCISSHNIVKAKMPSEGSSVGSYAKFNGIAGGSRNVIDLEKIIANENTTNQSKGKGVLIYPSSTKGHDDRRSDPKPNDSSKIVLGKNTSSSTLSTLKLMPVLNDGEACTPRSCERQKRLGSSSNTREKKTERIYCSGGESSVANSMMDSPIVAGDVSLEVREGGPQIQDDNEMKVIQLQVDEMMARDLQEQLYNEMLEAASSERISQLARQESMGAAYFRGRQHTHVNVGARPSHTRRNFHNPSSHNRLIRPRIPSSHVARSRAHSNPSTVASGRSGRFLLNMYIDTRMELLEALEGVANVDIRMINQLLHSDQEFGENDYEMLLALDENNHEHLGASAAQIDNLPESTVHSAITEVCSICLEIPTIGDTIRHLPCLHKFHKDCIDPWLRRKKSCPVCKSDI